MLDFFGAFFSRFFVRVYARMKTMYSKEPSTLKRCVEKSREMNIEIVKKEKIKKK
jgi:hypothetical protein